MTKRNDADAEALPSQLLAARADVRKIRSQIIRDLSWGGHLSDAISSATLISLIREYGAAVLKVTSLESQIENYSTHIKGVVQGDAVNLDHARREILDRIARFRERSGD